MKLKPLPFAIALAVTLALGACAEDAKAPDVVSTSTPYCVLKVYTEDANGKRESFSQVVPVEKEKPFLERLHDNHPRIYSLLHIGYILARDVGMPIASGLLGRK